MTINLYLLNDAVRDELNQIGFDHLDDKPLSRSLEAAYDDIVMIADYGDIDLTAIRESSLERCIIKLATFYAYRMYTRLAERESGTMPETAPLNVSYDSKLAKTCLETLLGVPLDEDLSPIKNSYKPCGVTLGYSTLEYDEY